VSAPTVLRLLTKLGFAGYTQFREPCCGLGWSTTTPPAPLPIPDAMLWGVGAISLTGRSNAGPTVEGFVQLVEGTFFAGRNGRRRPQAG
jgi:hypothetical protein